MIGRSAAFRDLERLIARLSPFDVSVLIEGETGTGKELAARAIHYCGPRRDGPFVPVNCGAIPDTLIESELFGHRRGAFTDARSDQTGLVALARGGTLFLDEIDGLTARGQVTLLRFLQDQRFRPLGSQREEKADLRIIAASNRDLERQVAAKEFRLDLLYRLKVMYLTLPPLRERHGDPAFLAEHFVQVASARFGKAVLPLDKATLAWFDCYGWPGNIRELENVVHREFLLAEGDRLRITAPACIAAVSSASNSDAPMNFRQAKDRAIREFESRFLKQLMGHANGNVSKAARISGTERRHLGRLLKKYRVEVAHPESTGSARVVRNPELGPPSPT